MAITAPGFSLSSIDLNRFCLTSSFSTIASITTSARPMLLPIGSAISRALAAARCALVLNLRLNSLPCAAMPLAICSALMSCSDTSMPAATHTPAMSAPIVPAPITCTRSGFQCMFLGACAFIISDRRNTRRRFFEVSLSISGAKARVSATFMPSRLPAWRLEQVDQAERRRIVLLAHLLGRLGAQFLGQQAARRPLPRQVLPERRVARAALALDRLARHPAQVERARRQLVDQAHAARGGGANEGAGQHQRHGGQRAGLPDRARRTVEAGEDAELHLGEAEAGVVVARGDAPVAGERQLQPAAQAVAVDAAHHRHRHALDAVEVGVDQRDAVGDLLLGLDLLELAHVGADDEALLLAGHDDEAADGLVARALLDALDDGAQLLQRPPRQRVLALALAVERSPRRCPADRSRTASPSAQSCPPWHYLAERSTCIAPSPLGGEDVRP